MKLVEDELEFNGKNWSNVWGHCQRAIRLDRSPFVMWGIDQGVVALRRLYPSAWRPPLDRPDSGSSVYLSHSMNLPVILNAVDFFSFPGLRNCLYRIYSLPKIERLENNIIFIAFILPDLQIFEQKDENRSVPKKTTTFNGHFADSQLLVWV